MMGQSKRWKLFAIRGHDIYLEPMFLLLIGFFAFAGLKSLEQLPSQLLWAPVLFFGILWHELGHAFAIERYGYGRSVIILQGLGGVTINRRGDTPPGKGAVISVAGPVFSLSISLLFALPYFLLPVGGLLKEFCWMMFMANLVWAVFNMLPISPLDGGHIVLHGLRAKFPKRKAYLYSAYSSLVVLAVLAIPMIMFLHPVFVVVLGLLFAMQNVQVIQALKSGAAI